MPIVKTAGLATTFSTCASFGGGAAEAARILRAKLPPSSAAAIMVNKMCDVGRPAVSCVHVAALRQRKLILQLRQLKTFQVRLNTVLEPTWKNALFHGYIHDHTARLAAPIEAPNSSFRR